MPRINDVFTGTVRDLSSEGNGIVEHESGRVFFVPGVWVGETASFRITGLKSRYGFARLEQLHQASAHRVVPPCPHQGFGAGQCGGCPWQFIDYPAQLQAKEQRLRRSLGRYALDHCIRPIWPSSRPFGYRTRARLKTDGVHLGFVSAGSKSLAPILDCLILTDKNRDTLADLLTRLPDTRFKAGKGHDWTTLDIDEDIRAEDVVSNQRRPFRQANAGQNEKMRLWLSQHLENLYRRNGRAGVIELFCGSGNFTEVIARAGFVDILAVEAVDDALNVLTGKRLSGVQTLACNLFLPDSVKQLRRIKPDAKILVLDPPREGFKNVEYLLGKSSKSSQIFHISCDPATFSRELGQYIERGFRVLEIQPLDPLPQTPHLEILAHLER